MNIIEKVHKFKQPELSELHLSLTKARNFGETYMQSVIKQQNKLHSKDFFGIRHRHGHWEQQWIRFSIPVVVHFSGLQQNRKPPLFSNFEIFKTKSWVFCSSSRTQNSDFLCESRLFQFSAFKSFQGAFSLNKPRGMNPPKKPPLSCEKILSGEIIYRCSAAVTNLYEWNSQFLCLDGIVVLQCTPRHIITAQLDNHEHFVSESHFTLFLVITGHLPKSWNKMEDVKTTLITRSPPTLFSGVTFLEMHVVGGVSWCNSLCTIGLCPRRGSMC